ncbi:hypothetical protein [Kitasatospora sp. NPDC057198]|uniref:hypothetical protein n=1 Tax=Kitasatospora sp. NPDC057198 TaxID=3346046 RepID=UPI003625BDD0
MAAGWGAGWPAVQSSDSVRELMERCLDGPGTPAYVLLLAWGGLVLNAAAICWAALLTVRTLRERDRPVGPGGFLLFAALPAALLAAVLQYGLLEDARAHSGPQRSPCEGAPLAPGRTVGNLPGPDGVRS